MGSKPGRPFGVTIAIFASILVYSIVPLLQVGMILLVESHFRNLDDTVTFPDGQEVQVVGSGGSFRGGISDERLLIQGLMGVSFLVVAALAWRGRPTRIRFVFIGLVTLLSLLTLGLTVIPALLDTSPSFSGGSLDILKVPLLCLQLGAYLVVPLYVIWYLNRAPARAFYRGYYLTPSE